MKITLSGKPISTNQLYRRHGNIIYMSSEGKSLKESYSWQAKSQWKKKPIITGKVAVLIDLYFNNNLRRDIDNWHKILLDSLTGIIWKDDSQIICMGVRKYIDRDNPRIEIEINYVV